MVHKKQWWERKRWLFEGNFDTAFEAKAYAKELQESEGTTEGTKYKAVGRKVYVYAMRRPLSRRKK